jgi:hypothetical protein
MAITDIRARYQDKPTEELLDILRKNDRATYREEVFEAIRQILADRKILAAQEINLPPQGQFVHVANNHDKPQNIVLTDIEIPFWSMVFFMVKWTVASIPAMIIIGFFGGFLWLIVSAVITQLAK